VLSEWRFPICAVPQCSYKVVRCHLRLDQRRLLVAVQLHTLTIEAAFRLAGRVGGPACPRPPELLNAVLDGSQGTVQLAGISHCPFSPAGQPRLSQNLSPVSATLAQQRLHFRQVRHNLVEGLDNRGSELIQEPVQFVESLLCAFRIEVFVPVLNSRSFCASLRPSPI